MRAPLGWRRIRLARLEGDQHRVVGRLCDAKVARQIRFGHGRPSTSIERSHFNGLPRTPSLRAGLRQRLASVGGRTRHVRCALADQVAVDQALATGTMVQRLKPAAD